MKRMCVCQLDEAPVEKPHPSPFLRSLSLEFGNSLECWARAGEQSCRLSQRRVLGLWRHLRGEGGCCRMLQNTDKLKHKKIIPSDYDHSEITTLIF